MNWLKKLTQSVAVYPFYEEGEEVDGSPPAHEVWDGVEDAFKKSKINILRDKRITQVATQDGIVIGGVVSKWTNNSDYGDDDIAVFDFDVAVNPKYRGNQMVGIKLIESAIRQYDQEKEAFGDKTMMRVWVINPRLVPVMEKRFGFKIEGSYEGGQAHMVKY